MYNDLAYTPFGIPYAQSGSTGVTDISFAGNNEDTTTSLYDAQFREYGIQGRWPSPDPAGMAATNPANPQSWNRYAYALNSPLNLVDPSGLKCGWWGFFINIGGAWVYIEGSAYYAGSCNDEKTDHAGGGRPGAKPQTPPAPVLPIPQRNWFVRFVCGYSPEDIFVEDTRLGTEKGALTTIYTGNPLDPFAGALAGAVSGAAAGVVCSIAGQYTVQ